MGLSSLAVMGNSLTLQLQGRPKLPMIDSPAANTHHSHAQAHLEQHQETQGSDTARANG